MANATPWSIYHRERDTLLIVQEVGWHSGPVWMRVEDLIPTDIQFAERPAHSESLYRYASRRWSNGIEPLFLNLAIRWNRGQGQAPAVLRGKDPTTPKKTGSWLGRLGYRTSLNGSQNSFSPARIRTSEYLGHTLIAVLRGYPGSWSCLSSLLNFIGFSIRYIVLFSRFLVIDCLHHYNDISFFQM